MCESFTVQLLIMIDWEVSISPTINRTVIFSFCTIKLIFKFNLHFIGKRVHVLIDIICQFGAVYRVKIVFCKTCELKIKFVYV